MNRVEDVSRVLSSTLASTKAWNSGADIGRSPAIPTVDVFSANSTSDVDMMASVKVWVVTST